MIAKRCLIAAALLATTLAKPAGADMTPEPVALLEGLDKITARVSKFGAPGAGRSHWTVSVFGEPDPVATGRTGELAGARSRAERALHAYTDAELSSHGRSVSG